MQPCRYLIVDSDPNASQQIGRTLSGLGYRLDLASTATEASVLAERTRYTTVLIADRLSDGDGLDCFVRLRRQHPGLIGVLTSETCDVAFVFSAVRYGISHVLRKPIDVSELLTVVSDPSVTPSRQSTPA